MHSPHSSGSTGPKAFLGSPSVSRVGGGQPARVVEVAPLPRSVPVLTVYADGRVRPSTAAVELLGGPDGICFYPPPPARPGYTPQLWQVSAGDCHLFRNAGHGGHIQLRAAGKCPPAGRYVFTPITGKPTQYALMPTG